MEVTMKKLGFMKMAVLSAAVATGSAIAAQSAQAQSMRVVNGQAYWRGDPGPVAPDPYWVGGQYKYDPYHFLSYYGSDPEDYQEAVAADHRGADRCVWRKRVVNSDWEFHHPYIRVCRQ
jgi:hypothetical protein